MATEAETSQRVSGEKSSTPFLVLFLGWLIPGAGHLLLGKYIRAALLFVSIIGMYAIGLGLRGQLYTTASSQVLDLLSFVGQLGLGLPYFLARWMGWGASSMLITLADYGTKFLVVAGLLNVIAAVDAYSLANGRKASE